MASLLRSYRRCVEHEHGWEVELTCPACGTAAVPAYHGWTPSRALGLGTTPTIYANLNCPRCGADLKDAAGRKLVELFAGVPIPDANRRLLRRFLLAVVIGLAAAFALGAGLALGPGWRQAGRFVMLAPLLLLAPAILGFNARVAALRFTCGCPAPAPKFLGLLGRGYCYRCSSCGRLLRTRD